MAERLAGLGVQCQFLTAVDTREQSGDFTLVYAFASPTLRPRACVLVSLDAAATPGFPSLATRSFAASRFEREVHDLFGLVARGHPDLRRLALHQFWPADYHPLRRDAVPRGDLIDAGQPFPFRRVEGEGLFEITVGPVHAGIIEPGHFRFTVEGETIVNLETRLGFVHKGTEKLFETLPLARTPELAERISGDTSAGHALAYCQALEALAGADVPPRARWLRTVLLELERLYNHVADVGMIVNDTGFGFGHAHCFRIREELLRLNARAQRPSSPARRDRPGRRHRSDHQGRPRRDRIGRRAARPRLRRDREPVAGQHDGARAAAGHGASDPGDRARDAGGGAGGPRQRDRRGRPARRALRARTASSTSGSRATSRATCGRARCYASTRRARRRG